MKKSLLALAVLGAFAGAASAQSSVTVYGLVDLGITSQSNGGGRVTGLESGNQSESRIGFKGVEDLGNGLKATFQLEGAIAADTGTTSDNSQLFNRVSTIGLQGAFGAITAGRQATVLKDAHDQIDPFGGEGATGNVERIFYYGLTNEFNQSRASNTIKYSSNNYSGFNAQAAYTFGEARGSNSEDRQYGLGLGYANGPLNVQFAYQNSDTTSIVAADTKLKIAFIGATYDFGIAKLHGAYADTKLNTPIGKAKVRNALIGVSAPVGAGTVLASYSINDLRDIPVAVIPTGTDAADSKQFAIAYTYPLSKRTNLYTGYARTSNDDNANVGGEAAAAGDNVSVFTVGIRHKF